MNLTYIEIKKQSNLFVTHLTKSISARHDEKAINIFLQKYKCNNLRDFVENIMCPLRDKELSPSIRETIDTLTSESHTLHFELDLITSRQKKSQDYTKYLENKLESLNNLSCTYNEKLAYVEQHLYDMNLILQKHKLNFIEEMKKIKPTSTYPKPPSR